MRGRDIFISVVLRVRDAEGFVTAALDRLVAVMEASFNYYEILIVDDASVDATRERVAAVQARARNIQLYALARRKGDNIALTAGLDHAIGDMVVMLDPRLDPPELIPAMVERAVNGAEIVYGLPRERLEGNGLQNLLLRGFVTVLAQLNNVDVPQAMSSYRLLNRNVLNYMLEAVDRHRSLMFLPALSGYPYATIEYDRLPGDGKARKSDTGARIAKALDLCASRNRLAHISLGRMRASGQRTGEQPWKPRLRARRRSSGSECPRRRAEEPFLLWRLRWPWSQAAAARSVRDTFTWTTATVCPNPRAARQRRAPRSFWASLCHGARPTETATRSSDVCGTGTDGRLLA